MNSVNLLGRLVKQPELRQTQGGMAIVSVTIAVNRKFKKDGQPEADFIQLKAFSKTAELIGKMDKGEMVGISGSWQTGSYDDNNGKRQYTNECIIDSITFVGNGNSGQGGNQQQGNTNTQSYQNNSTSGQYGGNNQQRDPFEGNGNAVEIDEDDYPF